MNKLNTLKRFESEVGDRIVDMPVNASDAPKKFITFPYPYMNGRLHLGHAYTLTKCDFIARYYKNKGFNVLFPFSFHGTGTPIYACANKVKKEFGKWKSGEHLTESSQIKILLSMGVNEEEIEYFQIPEFWILYFSKKASEDVKKIGIMSDMRRSFYTTELNPYYDRFVKWQFNHLTAKGYIKKGKRHVIYSPKDGQPCADHDRSEGENIDPVRYNISVQQIEPSTYIIITGDSENDNIYISETDKFIKIEIKGFWKYIVSENFYNNIKYQLEDVNIINDSCKVDYNSVLKNFFEAVKKNVIFTKKSFASGIYAGTDNKSDLIYDIKKKDDDSLLLSYYEPAETVVSRSGDKCIVALIDQWFINYNHADIKVELKKFVDDEFECYDKGIREQFVRSIDWLAEWPCSRASGLGTKLGGTDEIIDSLSDSTIYMALYTIYHILKELDIEVVTDKLFDCVFLNAEIPTDTSADVAFLIEKMKAEFKYWYPLDIRISGKDLIQNHLTMSLFNHFMIWEDMKMIPKSFMLNGYLMLNKKKMSKSTGNFMTLHEALEKYGADSTRFALAFNDGIDDGNFDEKNANGIVDKLICEYEWIRDEYISKISVLKESDTEFDFWDNLFNDQITNYMGQCFDAYEIGNFKKITSNFYLLVNAKNYYVNMKNKSELCIDKRIMSYFINAFINILEPICPFYIEYIKSNVLSDKHSVFYYKSLEKPKSSKYEYYDKIINNICGQINSSVIKYKQKKLNFETIEITIVKQFSEEELGIITEISEQYLVNPCVSKQELSKIIDSKNLTAGLDNAMSRKFISYIKDMMDLYGTEYIEWIKDKDSEKQIVEKVLSLGLISDPYVIKSTESDKTYMFKFGPGMPIINIPVIRMR